MTVDTSLTKIVEVDDLSVRVWGESVRVRNGCNFEQIDWFQGEYGGRNVRAAVTLEEPSKVRPGGAFTFGPWVVGLSQQELTDNSFAIVYHRCHPLWITQTRFY